MRNKEEPSECDCCSGGEGRAATKFTNHIKNAKHFKSWLCENLEPMLQEPRHWSRCRPIPARDRFIGGRGSDIAVGARSCVSRMPVLLIPRRSATS